MIRILSLVVFTAMLAIGCSEATSPTVPEGTTDDRAFTVNGGEYSNARFRGLANDESAGAEVRSSNTSITFSGLTPNDEVFAMNLLAAGTTPGDYPINSTSGTTISLLIGTPGQQSTFLGASGMIKITELGSSGGTARATFECTMVSLDGSTTLTVSNGTVVATVQ